ncbi:MAG: Maf family protein [bacterium]
MNLILASKSPRRTELLSLLGVPFTVVPSAHEEPVNPALPPEAAVRHIALMKGREVAARQPESLVLAADTLVFLDGAPLGKPRDPADAARMLRALSGREHLVITGIALLRAGAERTEAEVTRVRFRPMTEREIAWYVATGEPLDKAGAYGIQGRGAIFIEGIEGDYCNVVGLPLCRTARALAAEGCEVLS